MLSWKAKRKLAVWFIIFVVFALFLLIFYRSVSPKPTCFDHKKNQGEKGVDCGGPCQPCVENPKDLVVLWTRFFKIKDGIYDVAALVENPNPFYFMPNFKYILKLYDDQNILIAAREGESFANPQDKFVVFESGINTGKRIPARAFLEKEYLSSWQYLKKKPIPLVVAGKNFSNYPFASLEVEILNKSVFPAKNVYLQAVLFDEEGNAFGASATKIDLIKGQNKAKAFFTWPFPFKKEPFLSKIFIRTNLAEK